MIELKTPWGLPVSVPESIEEGPTPRFARHQLKEIRQYYDEYGYVVVNGLIEEKKCDEIRALWEGKVKKTDQFIYRQTGCKAERHHLNENGWVMNPILNLQSVDPVNLGDFRDYATDQILTHPNLAAVFEALFDDTPKVVQSMYFEGNSATWEHQDSYYLDSENVGKMAAAWIAIEPIEAQAGRFFICPRSHLLELERQNFQNNIAHNHDVYIEQVVEKIRELGLEIRAPRLEKGDTLFWNAWTIHGSLDSQGNKSRSSITCHAIPARDRFLQFQLRSFDLKTDVVNGVHVYRPKDMAKLKNRSILWVEGHFPKPFYWLKRTAISYLFKRAAA